MTHWKLKMGDAAAIYASCLNKTVSLTHLQREREREKMAKARILIQHMMYVDFKRTLGGLKGVWRYVCSFALL